MLDSKGVCRGITALDLRTMELKSFAADAIIIATGGSLNYFRKVHKLRRSAPAPPISRSFSRAHTTANGEFIQIHPTCIPGEDKLRLMSESARGEGGRVWVPRTAGDKRPVKQIPESDRWYFLEEVVPQLAWQSRSPRHRHPRHSQDRLRARTRHRRPAHGLPRPHPHRSRHSGSEARRHSRNLREVCRRRSPRRPHEDLPRHALHHGRPLGRLQSK